MKIPATIALLVLLSGPLHSQTVLGWALAETSTDPDMDATATLNGTLDVPIIGDGVTSDITNSSALVGRFTPVTLANDDDSITISYDLLVMGGTSSGGATNATLRWGLFNSNGSTFGGNEANFSDWSGAFAWNSGSASHDADIRVRNLNTPNRFYIATGTTDLTGAADNANQNFASDGVIYTATITITRLAGDIMAVSATLTGDDGYSLTLGGQETTNAEFTFDRVGFWVNSLGAKQVALKSSSAPPSTDGDSIPDLEEVRWFTNLTTADNTSNADGDALSDLDEITQSFTDPTDDNDPLPPIGIEIVEIVREEIPDPANIIVSITFTSHKNKTYSAFRSADFTQSLESRIEIDDSIPGEVGSGRTTFPIDFNFYGIPLDTPSQFFVVKENAPVLP